MSDLCRQTFERLQLIVDGELAAGPDAEQLLVHFEACVSCCREADALRSLKDAVARVVRRDCDPIVRRLDSVLNELFAEPT